MKKYITNLYGHGPSSTAMAVQNLVTMYAKKEGYSEIPIGFYTIENKVETEREKLKRIEGVISGISSDSIVIAQMPTWYGIAFDELLLRKLRERVEKLVVFVHDFVPLMFLNNEYLFDRYISAYNLSDLVILPSEKMEKRLNEGGLRSSVIHQDIWDYHVNIDYLETPTFKKVIKFIGNLERFPFSKEWKEEVPLEIFSKGTLSENSTAIIKGWMNKDELLRALSTGGFGLVWSENIDNQDEKKYSEMNASFKFSTYLAAGLPIIVNKGLAKEEFVTKYNLGFIVENLEQAVEVVQTISPKDYGLLVNNVRKISTLIKGGFFTRRLLNRVEGALFLEEKEK